MNLKIFLKGRFSLFNPPEIEFGLPGALNIRRLQFTAFEIEVYSHTTGGNTKSILDIAELRVAVDII